MACDGTDPGATLSAGSAQDFEESGMNGRSEPKRTLRLMLVEDNPADALIVRMALKSSWGAEVEITESARLLDALPALETGAYDLALLDLGLPDSQGLATFSVLHARVRSVPVVVLSAMADEATSLDAVRLGAQDYLIKGDFDAPLLARVIRHALERHHLLQQLERSLAYVRKLLQEIEGSAYPEEPGGMLAMCSWCKRVRAASGTWQTIEEYLAPRAQAQVTHGACPDCVQHIKQGTWRGGLPNP